MTPAKSDPLKLYEVGLYGELLAKPNPDGLVVLPVPPFEHVLPIIERDSGRTLTAAEIEEARGRAPSIALTKEEAEGMAAAREDYPTE
jgi:hypothetical protein